MQHYLMLSRGNFYVEKQHGNKALLYDVSPIGLYCVYLFYAIEMMMMMMIIIMPHRVQW